MCKAFANGSSANKEISKTQFSKMIQSGKFNILDLINPAEVVNKIANKEKELSTKVPVDEVIKTTVISRKLFQNLF